jgi:hypothetical protein
MIRSRTGFYPYISPSFPEMGMTTAAVRVYAVSTHAKSAELMDRSSAILGNVGTNMVSTNIVKRHSTVIIIIRKRS